MQRKKMGQLVRNEVSLEFDVHHRLDDSGRSRLGIGRLLLTKIFQGWTSVRSLVVATALLSFMVTRSFAQVEQPYTASLQPASADDLQQLVAPIALYPDALVAQILAASTYPTEVVQADRWVKANSGLQGQQLAASADQQPWDPSVKALTVLPSVRSTMDENLSWTTELGEVYFNQQQDVMNAVQLMRVRAEQAGTLRSTTQERVITDGPSIVIEPAYADLCYLPEYDPWLVYGTPIVPFPGYYYGPWLGNTFVSFGPAIRLGYFGGFGWGWPAWGFNWGSHVLVFNRVPYVSHSHFFGGHGPFVGIRGGFGRSGRDFGRSNHAFSPNRWNGSNQFRGFSGNSGRSFNARPGMNYRSFDRGGGFRGSTLGGGRNFGGGVHRGGFHDGGFHGGGGGRHR